MASISPCAECNSIPPGGACPRCGQSSRSVRPITGFARTSARAASAISQRPPVARVAFAQAQSARDDRWDDTPRTPGRPRGTFGGPCAESDVATQTALVGEREPGVGAPSARSERTTESFISSASARDIEAVGEHEVRHAKRESAPETRAFGGSYDDALPNLTAATESTRRSAPSGANTDPSTTETLRQGEADLSRMLLLLRKTPDPGEGHGSSRVDPTSTPAPRVMASSAPQPTAASLLQSQPSCVRVSAPTDVTRVEVHVPQSLRSVPRVSTQPFTSSGQTSHDRSRTLDDLLSASQVSGVALVLASVLLARSLDDHALPTLLAGVSCLASTLVTLPSASRALAICSLAAPLLFTSLMLAAGTSAGASAMLVTALAIMPGALLVGVGRSRADTARVLAMVGAGLAVMWSFTSGGGGIVPSHLWHARQVVGALSLLAIAAATTVVFVWQRVRAAIGGVVVLTVLWETCLPFAHAYAGRATVVGAALPAHALAMGALGAVLAAATAVLVERAELHSTPT